MGKMGSLIHKKIQ